MLRLKRFLPAAFFGLVGLISLLSMTLHYHSSSRSAEEAAHATLNHIGRRTVEKIVGFLSPAAAIVQLNAHLLALESESQFLHRFNQLTWRQLALYPQFSLVYFGDRQGNHWLNKRERDGTIRTREVHRLDDSAASRAALREAARLNSPEQIAALLAPYLETRWYGHTENGALLKQETVYDFNYDPRLRPWYSGALNVDNLYWTNVYTWLDVFKGQHLSQVGITVSMPVKQAGQMLGVAGIDITLKDISEFLAHLEISPHGRVFIFNNQGETVALSDFAAVIRKATDGTLQLNRMIQVADPVIVASYRQALGAAADHEGEGIRSPITEKYFTFHDNGERYFAYYAPITLEPALHWTIGVVVPEQDFLAEANKTLWRTLLISAISLLVVLLIGMRIGQSIMQSFSYLLSEARRISELDLRPSSPVKTLFVEFQELTDRFIRMKEELREMVEVLSGQTAQLNQSANELSGVASNMADESEKMRTGANRIASSTTQMSGNMNAISSEMQEMNQSIRGVFHSVDLMNLNMNTIATTAEESSDRLRRLVLVGADANSNMAHVKEAAQRTSNNVTSMAQAIEQMNNALHAVRARCESASQESKRVSAQASGNSVAMEKLDSAAKEIGNVVHVINRIAGQTSMLALNAAIEASRAGEMGKGFAVVSNEVKALAQQTANATQMIAQWVEQIRLKTDDVVAAFHSMTAGLAHINHSNDSILGSVDEQSSSIEEITQVMRLSSEETDAVTHRVGESAQNMDQVAQAMTHISKGITEVAHHVAEASNEISGMANSIAGISEGSVTIGNNVNAAFQSSQEIVRAMEEMHTSIVDVQEVSDTVRQRAQQVSHIGAEMRLLLDKFHY
nr:methyl-accepting chemotaxis protein [Candidatus Magnetaquicoccus inordinatus]